MLAAWAGRRSSWTPTGCVDDKRFPAPTEQVAAGWREGNTRKAVDRFTGNALHEAPLQEQLRSGRADLLELFGGAKGTESPMHTTPHHLMFDRARRIGARECTFPLNRQQDRVIVQRRGDRIARCREDRAESSLPVEALSAVTRF